MSASKPSPSARPAAGPRKTHHSVVITAVVRANTRAMMIMILYIYIYICYIYIYIYLFIHRSTYCAPELGKVNVRWEMSLTVRGNIRWESGNPLNNATEQVKLHLNAGKVANLNMPLKIHRKRPLEIHTGFGGVDLSFAISCPQVDVVKKRVVAHFEADHRVPSGANDCRNYYYYYYY